MKEVIIRLYSFEELSEESKQKAIQDNINIFIDHQWWDDIYSDAEEQGIEIEGFDIDRGNCCNIKLIQNISSVADNMVYTYARNDGEQIDIVKESISFLEDYRRLNRVIEALSELEEGDLKEELDINLTLIEKGRELNDLTEEYKKNLSNFFLRTLRDHYEYLTSDETVKEYLSSQGEVFKEDGTEL